MYNVLKSNLMTFFKTILSLEDFDELTILKTAAILDTNAFEVRSTDGYTKLRAIYPEAAMLSHDCVPNCYHSFDENMQMAIRAASKYKSYNRVFIHILSLIQSAFYYITKQFFFQLPLKKVT